MAQRNKNRPDKNGVHRREFDRNKKKILMSQDVCGICGLPVDKSLKFPDPMSPTVDHIIPIDKGGHPSDINNLQLAHLCCNNQKRNKIIAPVETKATVNNRDLPLSRDWAAYVRSRKASADAEPAEGGG